MDAKDSDAAKLNDPNRAPECLTELPAGAAANRLDRRQHPEIAHENLRASVAGTALASIPVQGL
jgi:hypothetical protein